MSEQNISVCSAVAWGLWLVAAVGVTFGIFGFEGIGRAGLLAGAAAATLHVRDCVAKQKRDIENAFHLGWDAGRLESVPTQRAR